MANKEKRNKEIMRDFLEIFITKDIFIWVPQEQKLCLGSVGPQH